MEKRIGSIKVNTATSQLFIGDMEIKCPYDVAKAYSILCTFEYLTDNYTNDEEILWLVASETRAIMTEVDYPISENEAIEKACIGLSITLESDELQ